MRVKELILKLKECDENEEIQIIAEETLECCPEIWDNDSQTVTGDATKLYSEDLYSHEYYLLALRGGWNE